MRKIPDIITFLRIILSFALLFVDTLSAPFVVLYLLCSISDIFDGFIARKLDCSTRFGAALDSTADIIFFAVVLVKLSGQIFSLSALFVLAACVIAALKASTYICGAVRFGKFVALHTIMNKITGVLLFCWPLTWDILDMKIGGAVVCAAAFLASAEELLIITRCREYEPDIKTVLRKGSP